MSDLSTPMPEAETFFNCKTYDEIQKFSIDNPEKFWGTLAKTRLTWQKPFTKVMECDMNAPSFKWFSDGCLNVSVQCVDRHLATRANQTALIFEQDKPGTEIKVTYSQLYKLVNQVAKVLKLNNVKKGDRVTLYMPMSPLAVATMLACGRIGAMHSVVFTGFSSEALASRIKDAKSAIVLTADTCWRGGRKVQLKSVVDAAVKFLNGEIVKKVLVYKRTGDEVNWSDLDSDLEKEMENLGDDWYVEPEIMNAEDPLFLLYTSGSTGKPKGIQHTQAGYILYAMMTTKYVYDLREGDIYACVADIGWITGHTYVVYGPLANGSTSVIFESTPVYPDAGRYWEMVQRLKITQFYTAPTAIRYIQGYGDDHVKKYDRSTLRVLGSVGEPINLEAWKWYNDVVGDKKCTVVDTWWQTETGGNAITPRPASKNSYIEPAIAMRPFFGIQPAIIQSVKRGDETVLENVTEKYPCEGALCIAKPWPGMARSIFEDHGRFKQVYYDPYPGYYFSGDGCIRTKEGYYKITGRMDDVINVSGHRMSTAEIEAVLTEHDSITESAVVGYPHDVKGEAPYAYVILREGASVEDVDTFINELKLLIRRRIAAFSVPSKWLIVKGLPKTRSGKIMRRILRKIASERFGELGDVSTLAEPGIVEEIINLHKARNSS